MRMLIEAIVSRLMNMTLQPLGRVHRESIACDPNHAGLKNDCSKISEREAQEHVTHDDLQDSFSSTVFEASRTGTIRSQLFDEHACDCQISLPRPDTL